MGATKEKIVKNLFNDQPLIVLVTIATLLLTISACGRTAPPAAAKKKQVANLEIASAASMASVLPKISHLFADKTGIKINLNYAASGILTRQIEAGAPIDIFISADPKYIDELIDKGLVYGDKETLAYGKLALIFSEKFNQKGLDFLKNTNVEQIAIANVAVAPYGQAAKETLENSGLWNKVKNKLIYGNDVAQTVQFVLSGNADAALVSAAQAIANRRRYRLIDSQLYQPIDEPMAILKSSANREAAREFIKFTHTAAVRKILRDNGFRVPNE